MTILVTREQGNSSGAQRPRKGLLMRTLYPDTLPINDRWGRVRIASDSSSSEDALRKLEQDILTALNYPRPERLAKIMNALDQVYRNHPREMERLKHGHARCLELYNALLSTQGSQNTEQLAALARLRQASYPFCIYERAAISRTERGSIFNRLDDVHMYDDTPFVSNIRYEPRDWSVTEGIYTLGSGVIPSNSYASTPLFVQQATRNLSLRVGVLKPVDPWYLPIPRSSIQSETGIPELVYSGVSSTRAWLKEIKRKPLKYSQKFLQPLEIPVAILPDGSGIRIIGPILKGIEKSVFDFVKRLATHFLQVPVYIEYVDDAQKKEFMEHGMQCVNDAGTSNPFWQTNYPELILQTKELTEPNNVLRTQIRRFKNYCEKHGIRVSVVDITDKAYAHVSELIADLAREDPHRLKDYLLNWEGAFCSKAALVGLIDINENEHAVVTRWTNGNGKGISALATPNLLDDAPFILLNGLLQPQMQPGARIIMIKDETNNRPIAIAKTWPITQDMVGLYVGVTDRAYPKSSAYLYHVVGKIMAEEGFTYFNVGPSETAPLYAFRRSLTDNPIETQYYTMRLG